MKWIFGKEKTNRTEAIELKELEAERVVELLAGDDRLRMLVDKYRALTEIDQTYSDGPLIKEAEGAVTKYLAERGFVLEAHQSNAGFDDTFSHFINTYTVS